MVPWNHRSPSLIRVAIFPVNRRSLVVMKHTRKPLRAGDVVRVRSLPEILATLNNDGTLDGVPFMPEMASYCGSRFTVSRRAEKTCVDLGPLGYDIREFKVNDVVILGDLLCSGNQHDGCGRACVLFWKEAWLAKEDANTRTPSSPPLSATHQDAVAQLRTRLGDGRYFCQSTELAACTRPMSKSRKMWRCVRDVLNGNRGPIEMVRLVCRPIYRKIRNLGLGLVYGELKRTPTEALNLQPGDWVTVKSVEEIQSTLDVGGRNRGLTFGMSQCCGQPFQVERRLDRMIMENTGEMRPVQNTVLLRGARCGCLNVLGGCPRAEFSFWREIWLKRSSPPQSANTTQGSSASPARTSSQANPPKTAPRRENEMAPP